MNFLIRIVFLIAISASNCLAQSEKGWELSRTSDGVNIYMRKNNNSPVKKVMGKMTVKSSLAALVYLVKDSENHYQWIYANKQAQMLKSMNNFEWIYYNESQAPWPVSNRDIITHAKLSQDTATLQVVIDSKGIPKYIPEKEGLVRIPKLITSWEFTPRKNGMVEVRFELEIDLGGNIPPWLVNMSIDRGPLHTLQYMSKLLVQEKYKKIKLPYIKEQKK
jgi:hypothetical protein